MTKAVRGDWIQVGRFWHNTRTRQTMPVIQGGALPATDAFTAADGTSLTTYSANWTHNAGSGFAIWSNAVYCTNGGDGLAHWNADAFNNNQYGQVAFPAVANAEYYLDGMRRWHKPL